MARQCGGSERAYYPLGKLKSVAMFGPCASACATALQTTWYENGQQHTKEDYRLGRRDGELLGVLPRWHPAPPRIIAGGQPGQGECFGPGGQAGGVFSVRPAARLFRWQRRRGGHCAECHPAGQFPEVVAQMGLDARIRVRFTVSPEGQVDRCTHSTGRPSQPYPRAVLDAFQRLKQEAEWMVAHLKPFRPALLDGVPVAYEMMVPIGFTCMTISDEPRFDGRPGLVLETAQREGGATWQLRGRPRLESAG